jgi:hypothetical protein
MGNKYGLCSELKKMSRYIKMNRIYFFLFFALIQGWFKKKKKMDKLPGKLENSGKTESAFFFGNGWNDLTNIFFNPYEVFM